MAEKIGELPAAHARHHHIGYRDVDLSHVTLGNFNRFFAVTAAERAT